MKDRAYHKIILETEKGEISFIVNKEEFEEIEDRLLQ